MEILLASVCIAAVQVLIWLLVRSLQARKKGQPPKPLRAAEIAKAASNLHPFPIWAVDQQGQITWQNKAAQAYPQNLIHDCISNDDDQNAPYIVSPSHNDQHNITKIKVGPNQIYFARPPSATQKEKDRVIKTLASSFSNLPIGLAIFDENHTLHTFNPSLTVITSAKPEFLTQRPSIGSFFDHLRTIGFLSEPKDYKSWRKDVLQHTDTDCDVPFSQSWTNASNSTFRMTLKPDASGGVILFINDISQSTNQTREHAWKRDVAYAALDTIDAATILFDQDGCVIFCNEKYRNLWAHNPLKADAVFRLADCQRIWQLRSDKIENLELEPAAAPSSFKQSILLKSGQRYMMTTKPLRNRATMVEFSATIDMAEARMRA